MNISTFMKMIGAKQVNDRWSWGAERRDGSVVLKVWAEEIRKLDDEHYFLVDVDGIDDRLGRKERIRHLNKIRAGAKCYLVLCRRDKQKSTESHWVTKSFTKDAVYVGGEFCKINDGTYIKLDGKVRPSQLKG